MLAAAALFEMSPVRTFRKKPIEVDAIQWTGTDKRAKEIIFWVFQGFYNLEERRFPVGEFIVLNSERAQEVFGPYAAAAWTNEGYSACVYDISHSAWLGVHTDDWIIKGLQDEFYPCAPEDFNTIYEAVSHD